MNDSRTLSDNQRRFVCRIVFLFLCALPTALSVYSLTHQPGPEYWENAIRAQLGIPVQIASVETPVPFTTVLRGVRIPGSAIQSATELESDLLVDEIRIQRGERKNIVTVVQPIELPAEGLTTLVKKCSGHLEQFSMDQQVWQFDFAKIVLSDDGQSTDRSPIDAVVLQPVGLRVQQVYVDGLATVQCDFITQVDPGGSAENPKLAMVLRKFPAGDQLKLKTSDGAIPARLLRFWQPELDWLGSRCRFSGTIEIANAAKGQAEVQGRLIGVELDRLSKPFSLGIRGNCDVYDLDCRFDGNQITSAGMRIHSHVPISVSSSLLADCRQLGIQTGPLTRQGDYSFPNLDLRVDIEMGRLLLSGNNGSVISTDEYGEPLMDLFHADATVHNLASILTYDPKSNRAIAFLKKFRTLDRSVRQGDGAPTHY